ncbi:MAG: hypothetical protein C0480_02910 [Bradyrhizobium sp.]|nr:hypothetical protein [Bradyrhizobium sp.]
MEASAMSFEAGPANPAPFTGIANTVPQYDLLGLLGTHAAHRLRQLRQLVSDKHAVLPLGADIRDAADTKLAAERQLQRLLASRSQHGFNLDPTDQRVGLAEETLAKATDDLRRIRELDEVRSASWRDASATLVNVEQYLRLGRPGNTTLRDLDPRPEPKLSNGEKGLIDAIENRRRNVREAKATLHRIASACFPSSYCKMRMREMVEQIAMLGQPDIGNLLEHDRNIVFPTQRVQSSVVGLDDPALAFTEIEHATPFAIWLGKETVIKRLDALIDSECDDKNALSHEQRERAEAEVQADVLAQERIEAALVWRGLHEGLAVSHRTDCTPVAILECEVVTAPRAGSNGHRR